MSNKENKEIAAEILIAAITAKAITASGHSATSQAQSLMQAYGVILDGVRGSPPSAVPKKAAD